MDSLLSIQRYIESELISYGYEIERHEFSFDGNLFENIAGSRRKNRQMPYLLIGSHFDAVPQSPGADDNASAVAAFLETARILSENELTENIEFVAFNLEEYSMIGSSSYARYLREKEQKLLGMISLEMIGYTSSKKGSQKLPLALRPFYPDVGDFLALVGDENSKNFLAKAEKAFKKSAGLKVECLTVPVKGRLFPETRLSDHSPFWDEGFPALLVTDTSFFRNPNYHRPSDTIDTLDMTFLRRVTEGIVHLAMEFS
ncbi:MAG: M28 family peptidase [Candidatus Omnitrophica bacterium]|nr:M28 family peptidase [Candidatus Omnitrophota bacterium]